MTTKSFAQQFYALVKQQRQVLSAALIVSLFMLLGHVPVLPVLTGCALAIGISFMRSKTNFSVLKRVRPAR
jgi:hypothetical protein